MNAHKTPSTHKIRQVIAIAQKTLATHPIGDPATAYHRGVEEALLWVLGRNWQFEKGRQRTMRRIRKDKRRERRKQ